MSAQKKTIFSSCLSFIKKELVLSIAGLLAILSGFFVPPSRHYLESIDFRVLALLFCLMLVVAGLQKIGFFQVLGNCLLSNAKNTRSLCILLVFLCFFSSMLITNDVALITFVPFSIMILTMANQPSILIPVVVLQTIGANLGSMLTPVGNPQNLFLYSTFGISMGEFLTLMFPLTLISALLLVLCIYFLPNHPVAFSPKETQDSTLPLPKTLFYFLLFGVCLLCVLRILPWPVMLGILVIAIFLQDRALFADVDYFLLLTFVFFFLFIGNMQSIPAISDFLRSMIAGRELWLGVSLSQIISNVPAAILLSGFTQDYKALLYGIDLGGLGTLIASLASLISYRLYGNWSGAKKGTYLKSFTLYSILFLIILLPVAFLLCR